MSLKHARTIVLVCLAVAAGHGCAGTKLSRGISSDVAPIRGERRELALQQFEVHRDTAQYQSALDRWKSGDPFTCEAQLRSLVSRNPRHVEARQALADLALERGELAKAEQEMRALLEIDPQHPETHLSLGLLLQSLERHDEARSHFAQAAQLAPENTLYQLCAQPELLQR